MDNRLYFTNKELATATEIYEAKANSLEEILAAMKKAESKYYEAGGLAESYYDIQELKTNIQQTELCIIQLTKFSKTETCHKIKEYYAAPTEEKWTELNKYLEKDKAYNGQSLYWNKREPRFFYKGLGYFGKTGNFNIEEKLTQQQGYLASYKKELEKELDWFNEHKDEFNITLEYLASILPEDREDYEDYED
jgi:hypothetical protein